MRVDAKEYEYAVVQFLKRPRQDIGDFVCIPHSWIRIRRATKEQSIVAYPSECPLVTQKRIEDREKPSEKWELHLAIVKLETNTYRQAKNYVLERKYGVATDDLCSSLRNERNSTLKRPQQSESQLDAIMKKLKLVESNNGGSFFQNKISQAENTSNILPTKKQPFIYPHIQKIPDCCKDNSPENDCKEIGRKPFYISRDVLNSMKQHLLKSQPNSQQVMTEKISEQSSKQSKSPRLLLDDEHISRDMLNSIKQHLLKSQCNSPQVPIEKISEKSSEQSKSLRLSLDDEHSGDSDIQANTLNIVPTKKQTFIYPHIQKIPDYCKDNLPGNDCKEIGRKPFYISRDMLNSMEQLHLKSQCNSPRVPTEKISEKSSEHSKSLRLSLDNESSRDSDIQMIVDEPVVTQEDDDSNQSSPGVCTEVDQSDDYPINRIRTKTNFIASLLDTMETSYANSSEAILEVHKSFDQFIKLIKDIKKKYNSKKMQQDKEKAPEVEETAEMNKDDNVKSSSHADEDDETEDENKAPKKPCDSLRKFVLPPDYNPKDTRWTLKYREKDPDLGLVELVPGSKVYVNPINLAHCKRVSKDCKTLARKLLAEIFSLSALSVCSLTGAKANAFHNNGTYVRPGLDANARETMLTFVEDYAREKQWAAYDKQSVVNSVRSRIQEIRSKRART